MLRGQRLKGLLCVKTLQKGDHVYLRDDVRYTTPTGNAVKHFCEAFLVMEWWSDCLHSTRLAKKNVREAGTLRLRPGWADTTSAGAVRPCHYPLLQTPACLPRR